MAARVKKRPDTSTNRESDKIIVRLPEGMREDISALAEANSRSMTAEVVEALKNHLNSPDHRTMIRDLWGMIAVERAEAEELRAELKDLVAVLKGVAKAAKK
jgi:hypothetical protein